MGHLRPYRGKKSQAIRNNIVLKRGEIFLEIPESGLGTAAGKFKVGDGATGYADLPYFLGDNAGAVRTVNQIQPDEAGNVTLSTVPYAENLISPDNMEEVDTFIFRTSGGSSDITSGTAHLNMIGGNCVVDNGVITPASPSSFKSIGLNQFDKLSMVLSGYTINSAGAVVSQSGSYVCYVHAVGGLDTGYLAYSPTGYITKIGWSSAKPTTSSTGIIVSVDTTHVTAITNNARSSIIKANFDGYVCVVVSNTSDLVVHPKWSGTADTETADYTESVIQIPTQDVSGTTLPTGSYGFPAVGNVRDEMNLAQRLYTQRIGHYPYSAANLNTVKALDVDYIYDSTHIFYVLPTPVVFTLATAVNSEYEVNDYGTEEFLGTTVGVYTNTVYGANLRDKLRRDVVTISKQDLSASQSAQVRDNIDAAANHLIFTEAADAPNETLLNTIISGNPMNTIMGANKRLLRRYNDQIASKVASVNTVLPDANGDVTLNRVPMADNLYSPDNNENYGDYLCRTAGGSSDLSSGTAQLSYIRGTMSAYGRVAEELSGMYNTTYVPDPEETYVTPSISTIDAATWRTSPLGTNSGTYTFTYNGTAWTYNNTAIDLATYGIEVYGTVKNTDTIVVTYVKENRGTLQTLKPTSFVATGLNCKSGVLNNTGITSGKIAAKSGSYLYYAKAPYSDSNGYIAYDSSNKITNLGFVADTATPAVGKTVDSSNITLGSAISTCVPPTTSVNDATGWVVVECSAATSNICIHPRWSGGNDTVSEAYATTSVTMPTKDANNNNLPYVSYGLPAVGSVADEINFDLKQYIQRVGHYAYSAANLATVQALGVDYDYDLSHIFYVLTNPVTYNLSSTVSGEYTVNDYGIEYFVYSIGIGSRVNGNVIWACHLYGQNLRDKLRRDVLTISQQTLTDAQKTQVLANIGAASAASVTQLNNDLYYSQYNKNGMFRGKSLGTLTAANVDAFFTNANVSGGQYNDIYVGDYVRIQDGLYNTDWMVAGIATYTNKGDTQNPQHVLLIPRDYLHNIRYDSESETYTNTQQMNTTNTTGVSKNELNPLYNDVIDPSTGEVIRPGTHGEELAGAQCYYGSDMNQIYIPQYVTQLKNVLHQDSNHTNHIVNLRVLLSYTMNMTKDHPIVAGWKGIPSNWAWFSEEMILPTESEIYGFNVWSCGGYDIGINNSKLPVFNFIPYNIFSRPSFWLRSVAYSTNFCDAGSHGYSNVWGASVLICVRPLIAVK